MSFSLSKIFKKWLGGSVNKRSGKNYICADCRRPFYVTPIEISFYLSSSTGMPSICRLCKIEQRDSASNLSAGKKVVHG